MIAPIAAALGMTLALVAPLTAAEHYCLSQGGINWNAGTPHPTEGGAFEFWIDLASGDWRGRTIGSRALFSDGGTFAIVSDGTGYRAHWVGIEDHGGFESVRIDLRRDPMVFIRLTRDGFAETGTCVETDGRRFIDGVEMTQ